MNQIKKYTIDLINEYKPECVTIEDIQMQGNRLTYSKLSGLKYILIDVFIEMGLKYEVIPSVTYRSFFKLPTNNREKCKEADINFANKTFSLELSDDDICDAITQGFYFVNKIAR